MTDKKPQQEEKQTKSKKQQKKPQKSREVTQGTKQIKTQVKTNQKTASLQQKIHTETQLNQHSLESFYSLTSTERLQIICKTELEPNNKNKIYTTNFPNKILLKHIGFADIFPPQVRSLTNNGTTYTRVNNGGFFDNKGRYLPAINGTQVQIKGYQAQYSAPTNPFIAKEKTKTGEKPAPHIAIANNLGICPNTLKVASELQPNTSLALVARYIQNATQTWKRDYPNKKLNTNTQQPTYTPEFLTYCYSRLNLTNTFLYQKEKVKDFIDKYQQYSEQNYGTSFDFDKTFQSQIPTLPELAIKSFPAIDTHGKPELHRHLKSMCKKYELDYNSIYRLIYKESQWDPTAANKNSSAKGLGQFLDSTWEDVKKHFGSNFNVLNPMHNLEATCWNIRTAMNRNPQFQNHPKQGLVYYLIHHEGPYGAPKFINFLEACKKQPLDHRSFETYKYLLHYKTAAKGLKHVRSVYRFALTVQGPN